MSLYLEHVTQRFGQTLALNDIDREIRNGELDVYKRQCFLLIIVLVAKCLYALMRKCAVHIATWQCFQ